MVDYQFREKANQTIQGIRLVPMERLELSRCCHRGILNPLRLPFRHIGTPPVLMLGMGRVNADLAINSL